MGCEWYNPVSYGSCVSDVAKSAAGDAFHSIAESFGQAAGQAVNWLWGQLNSATAVHLGGAGFGLDIGITATIAGVVAVGLFTIQLMQSVLRRDGGGIGRAVKGLLIAFIGGGVAVAVVNLLLGATDSLCSGVVKVATGTDMAGLGKLILAATALTSTVNGSAALLLLSLACIVATVIVYTALVVRKVLIVLTAVFAPIAFAGSLADVTVFWTRRWIETTVALVASKLVLVLIFVTGYGILIEGVGQSGSGATQKVTQVISGVIVLFLAGFAPWLALKIVHFTGEHANQLHALGASAVGGVAATGRMAQKAAPYVSRAAMPAAAGASAAGGGSTGGGSGGRGGVGGGDSGAGGPRGIASGGLAGAAEGGAGTTTTPGNAVGSIQGDQAAPPARVVDATDGWRSSAPAPAARRQGTSAASSAESVGSPQPGARSPVDRSEAPPGERVLPNWSGHRSVLPLAPGGNP